MYFPPLGIIETQNQKLKEYKFIGGFEEDADVFLWYRENGERKIIKVADVPHYFCTSKLDFEKINKPQLAKWKKDKYFDNGKIVGDYAYFYRYGTIYRNKFDEWLTSLDDAGIKPLEADISRVARLMMDLELSVAPLGINGPKVVYFDIETKDDKDRPTPGEDRILSIVFKDHDTGEEFFDICAEDTDVEEKEFLKRVLKFFVKYDVAVGYNNYGYDDICLEGRFKHYSIDTKLWRRISTLDVFNLFERQGTFQKYKVHNRKLDTIAKAVVGRGKVEHIEKIHELWRDNRVLLEEYNKEDVRLIYEMEKKLGSVALILSICSQAGLLHSFGYSPAKCVDTFVLRQAVQRRKSAVSDFRYPTQYFRPEHKIGSKSPYARNALSVDKRKGRKEFLKEEFDIDYDEVEGGFVLDAVPGLYPRVVFSDFNSLYPSHIIAFNIGPDTLVSEENGTLKNKAPNGIYFRTDFQSGMSSVCQFLLETRAKIKAQMKVESDLIIYKGLDLQQNSVKELTNSIYGVTAQWGGRYYNKDVAESITTSGRTYLPFGQKWFAERGLKMIAGDTDSVAIAYGDTDNPEILTNEYIISLRQYLRHEYDCYRPGVLNMSVEKDKTFTPMLVLAKKNYVGKKPDGEISIYGLQAKKGNIPAWSSKISVDILERILSGRYNCEYFERYIQTKKDELELGNIPLEDFFISARLSKDVDEYESQLPHLRIAKRLIERGQHIPTYTTITYAITGISEETELDKNGKKVKRKRIDGLADSEINGEVVIDAQHYWNMILLPQLEKYLTIVFPEKDWSEFAYPNNLKRTPFEKKVLVKRGNLQTVL